MWPAVTTHVPETRGRKSAKLLKQTRTIGFLNIERLLPFNTRRPGCEALPGSLHTSEYVLQEGYPDGLQDGINGIPEKILLNAAQAR